MQLLPSHAYDPQHVYVRSTNFTRTIESARCLVTGLFGADGRHVHVITEDENREELYPNTKMCPRLKELFQIGECAKNLCN